MSKSTAAERLEEIAQHLDAMERMNGEDGCLEEAQSFAEDAQLVRNVAKDLRELEQVKSERDRLKELVSDVVEDECPSETEWNKLARLALQGSKE